MERKRVDTLGVAPLAVVQSAVFDDFYRDQYPRLLPLARALAGPAIADDVAQEAMLAAYRNWRRVSELEAPAAWVRRTCANLAVSAFRRRVSETKALLRLGRPRENTEAESGDEEFWSAVRALPKRQAQAAALRYLYEMPVAEIAETLQISQGSVKQQLTRARAALVVQLHLDTEEER